MEALIQDCDLLLSFFEHAAIALLVLGDDLRIESVNPAACRMLGYGREELLATPVNRIAHEEDWQLAASRLGELRSHNVPSTTGATRWLHKQGHVVWGLESMTVARDRATNRLRIFVKIQDASDRLETERIAAVAQMVTGLAHESRNALQQIGACAEMLSMELGDAPEALDLVAGIQEAEGRLLRVLNDVRSYAARLQLEPRPADVGEVWRAAWAGLHAHERQCLHLIETLGAESLLLSISPAHLEQAFIKVFENAIDAAAAGGNIEVRCTSSELHGQPALTIAVVDRGPGFSEEALGRAFEPFFTLKTQGTGLGLPIVRRIVEAHGGTVHIANAECGGMVELCLPRHEAPATSRAAG